MGLRYVFGRAGSGKSTFCLEEISQELRLNPWGTPLILLVPEQTTYQMEVNLAKASDLGGSLRAQVLSFRRLVWRVFSETGGGQKVLIGGIGKRMLLRRILLKHRLRLRAFARTVERPGMANLLAQTIGEFKTYRVSPKDLRDVQDNNELLMNKLHDLAFIFDEFQMEIDKGLLDPDDELSFLAEKIGPAHLFRGAHVWVDGFTGFTPQEIEVLKNIFLCAKEVVITLPLEPSLTTDERLLEERTFKAGDELFTGPWQTYQALQRIAAETGTHQHPPKFLVNIKRFKHPWLYHLEKNFFSYPTVAYDNCDNDEANKTETDLKDQMDVNTSPFKEGVEIYSAVNRRAEIEGIARELRNLARDEGLRWNEMAIMTRDLAGYHDLIAQVFTSYEIPYFLDYKRSVIHHPLIELLQSLPEAAETNLAYEPLFRCLKSDFFPLSRDDVDRLENYAIEHGVHGDGWGETWQSLGQRTLGQNKELRAEEQKLIAELNEYREKVYNLLFPFIRDLKAGDHLRDLTVRDITYSLYTFLERLKVPETLSNWSKKTQEEGNLSEAKLHEQIWDAVLQVLDEMVAGLGEECLTLEEYTLVLTSGLEAIELGLIPPGLDQVLVGSLDRSRNPEVRVLFLLGANEGILPAYSSFDGVLDAGERETLEHEGIVLAPKGKAQIFEEQFYIYTALTRATEKLIITYPLTDEEGKGLSVSPVVKRLCQLFPELQEGFFGMQKELQYISQADTTLQSYAEQLRLLRQGKALSPLWQAAEKWLSEDPARQKQVGRLKSSLLAKNQEDILQRPLARRLYGKRLRASISRLEQFAKCPFGHYARYGLNLRERPVYKLSKPDIGEFFHALLRDFAQELKKSNLDWGTLTKEQSWTIVNELADKLAPELQHKILFSSARYRYLTYKLKRTVHHAVRVLAEHARRGVFIPIQLEVGFGPKEILPGIEIPLAEGDSLFLSGQIDRVDAAFLDGQVYLRIFDYKSREQSLSLDSIYYGLNLQLLTYLSAALQGAEILIKSTSPSSVITMTQGIPAGFLYFPVLEPQLDETFPLSEQELEAHRIKAVKVHGFLLANPQVLEAMDSALASGQSDLLGIKINKDGAFKRGSNILTEEQFSLLINNLHRWFRAAGEEILNGNIALSPYRRGKSTGCQYCVYKPICHFDPYLPENQYRDLPVLKQEEVWQRLNSFSQPEKRKPANSAFNWLGESSEDEEGRPHE
jgi:ATP-dependent helicase/nuclease subunit B